MAPLPGSPVPRFAQQPVEATLADTPVTVLQGARQVGKSTLARAVLDTRRAPLLSLDNAAVLSAARTDPDGFVRQREGLLGIDEAQRVPELIRAIKDAVDEDRRPGRFLLTGSANLLHVPGTEESLAGRAETVVLYGFSQGELTGQPEDFLDRLLTGDLPSLASRTSRLTRADYLSIVCAGSYPEPRTRPPNRRAAWYDNYIRRIVSADARDLSRLGHLDRLPTLIRLIAANTAGELVVSRLAADAGIPERSLPPYLDLLETLYLVHRLPAWGGNLTRRVVGRPKLALLDTGLAARLINVTPQALAPGNTPDHAGSLLETFVSGELRRQGGWSQRQPQLFHFRDIDGGEVDIVVEGDDRTIAGIEVKAAMTVGAKDFRGLTLLRDKLGDRFRAGVVLHCGTTPLPFGDRLFALPLAALWT